MQRHTEPSRKRHPDDIVLWPDGCWGTLSDLQRLREAGILDEIGWV